MHRCTPLLLLSTLALPGADVATIVGAATLVDEIRLADAGPGHRFATHPADASAVADCGGIQARIMANEGGPRFLAVRVGEGKGLTARATYALEVDVVEDRPRSFFIFNRGDDTARGVACGAALPDTLHQYTQQNPEVLAVPLAKGVRTWRSVFRLHDRFADLKRERSVTRMPFTPADGFWVIIAQPEARRFPGSAGAAVSAIRLRHIADPTVLDLAIRRPPKDLPWRHLFWREEMADGVISGKEADKRGVTDRVGWYEDKLATMRRLGIDVFCKDLLEFGHNQGWDSAPCGGSAWVNQTAYPELWGKLVAMAGKAGVSVLPYYEYAGSIGQQGLGNQRRCQPLGDRKEYTHITWSEKASCDVTDAAFREDFGKVLDCTIGRFKGQADVLGVWLRPRSSAMPMSFADAALKRFADATGTADVTRERMRKDQALRGRYYDWWFLQRRDFLIAVRDLARQHGVADPTVLYTAYPGEPTPTFKGDALVVEGDASAWGPLLATGDKKKRPIMSLAEACTPGAYLATLLAPPMTWGGWEWQHACPQADPAHFKDVPGVAMTYPYNRVYTVADPAAMEAFRAPAGLAMVRHQTLNEHSVPEDLLGYICADMERAGPATVLADVLAVANGDPRWLGILSGMSLTTGFPDQVRAFNAAFLALPACPSRLLANATATPGVIVRAIDGGKHGTWLAVANRGHGDAKGVAITLPHAGPAVDAATGSTLAVNGTTLTLDLAPCSLRAVHIAR